MLEAVRSHHVWSGSYILTHLFWGMRTVGWQDWLRGFGEFMGSSIVDI